MGYNCPAVTLSSQPLAHLHENMIKAYHLSTGLDGHSHVIRGNINTHELGATDSIHFEESAAHSSLDWHNAPTTQYVITLSGVLEFVMFGGETFTVHAGEILIAMDTTGSGHQWRLVNDQPWKRAYVTFKQTTDIPFRADEPQPPASHKKTI